MKEMTKVLGCRSTALVKQWPPESMTNAGVQEVVVSSLIGGLSAFPMIITEFNSQPTHFKWPRQCADRCLRLASRTKIESKV